MGNSIIENIRKDSLDAKRERDGESSEIGPGVSKYAIMQLMQSKSDRIQFEESQTHSTVWEKFLKIVLDNAEVPFVCCKYCKKVYTHDRTLGTSSLIRHQCGDQADSKHLTKSGELPRLLVQELVVTKSDRVGFREILKSFNERLKDVTEVFNRVMVDEKKTEYISCKTCSKLYSLSSSKNNHHLTKQIEVHECYIKNAPHVQSVIMPKNEKECFIIFVREPQRIVVKDKVKNEPNLHYFHLDEKKTNFVHCTKCLRFFALDSLNLGEERIHR